MKSEINKMKTKTIYIVHCGQEEDYDRHFDRAFFDELDIVFGTNKSRALYSERVRIISIHDIATINRKLEHILPRIEVALFDSFSQYLRQYSNPGQRWLEKNSLLIKLVDMISSTSSIKKRIFLNYPFSIFQTRRENSSKSIRNIIDKLRYTKKIAFVRNLNSISKQFGINRTVISSSLLQVYIREEFNELFNFVDMPFLVPGIKEFKNVYLSQGNVLDDMIAFMRDGLFNKVTVPFEGKVPIIPIDTACDILLSKVIQADAMIEHLFKCPLTWQNFLFLVSDHYSIHSFKKAYSSHEILVDEDKGKANIELISDRLPFFLNKKTSNMKLSEVLKEFRMLMRFSAKLEDGSSIIDNTDWKSVIDNYIYGVRKFYLKEKLSPINVYLKYGVIRGSAQYRKHNFFHWSYLKEKAKNCNEFDTAKFKQRLLNSKKLRKAIDEETTNYLKQNPSVSEKELETRKRKIEVDIDMNFSLLRTQFDKLSIFSLALPIHFFVRKVFDGVYFDNKFIEFVRNHDYRNGPIIFLPTHKSYFDFLILSYLMVMRDGQPPLIGAADNMNNIFFVSETFQKAGAFYIKRTGQKFPKIYRTLLNEYMKLILENETNIEFFIEATRSRTGQVLYPKFGFLKYVLEAYLEKRIPNAILCPVNITYENLLEADSYIVEHRGGQKIKEDTMRVIKGIGIVRKNYGKIILNSSQPISLKKYVKNQLSSHVNVSKLKEVEGLSKLTESLGLHITDILQNHSVFMITHLVCCVLLMRHHYQLVKDLEKYVILLKNQIKKRKGVIFEIETEAFNFEDAIKCFRNRLSIRGQTFNEKRVCISKSAYIENCLAIKYYANSVNYLFFKEALIYFCLTNHPELEMRMDLEELWRRVSLLQSIFSFEVFVLDWFKSKEEMLEYIRVGNMTMLRVNVSIGTMNEKGFDDVDIEVKPDLNEDELLLIELYSLIIPPLFYAFMILFICVYKGEEGPNAKKFLKIVQKIAEKVHGMGITQNAGFCSMVYIKSAYKHLVKDGWIEETPQLVNKKIVKSFRLLNGERFQTLIKGIRDDFNWRPNYQLIKRVFFTDTRAGAELPKGRL